MKGRFNIKVKNNRLQYKFTVERNITILRGDSATGKTTLIDMIYSYQSQGRNSGISLECDKQCIVVDGSNWKYILPSIKDSIVFIDEGDNFVKDIQFSEFVKNSDNYFVIVTRCNLFNLPYSIKEIYGIKNKAANKYQGTKRLYSEFYPIHDKRLLVHDKPDCIIVEDSNSGYDFFKSICKDNNIDCISAGGNSNIEHTVANCNYDSILIIADGAAFGPYIQNLLHLSKIKNISVFLPESFEWLILKSGVVDDSEIDVVLAQPYEYIESSKYFSWEQFFTELIIQKTKYTYQAYSKKQLNPVYLQDIEKQKIINILDKDISVYFIK